MHAALSTKVENIFKSTYGVVLCVIETKDQECKPTFETSTIKSLQIGNIMLEIHSDELVSIDLVNALYLS